MFVLLVVLVTASLPSPHFELFSFHPFYIFVGRNSSNKNHENSMSQVLSESILSWLENTASPKNSPATYSEQKKRKRDPLQERLPTTMNSSLTRTPSPSKKRRIQNANVDGNSADNTPQPPRTQGFFQDPSHTSNSSTRSSVMSSPSRSQSPKKQMTEMFFAPQPILYKQFLPRTAGELPAELDALLQIIARSSRGIGVVSDAYKVGRARSRITRHVVTKI